MSSFYNSTIKRRFGLCEQCGDGFEKFVVKSSDGILRCERHYSAYRNKLSRERIALRDADKKDELDKWFEKIIKQEKIKIGNLHCFECGLPIPVKFERHSVAHILPKAYYDSVKTHPLNYLILGASCGCHQKTDRWDKFQTMKVWPLALERIIMMEPELTPKERGRLPEIVMRHCKSVFE